MNDFEKSVKRLIYVEGGQSNIIKSFNDWNSQGSFINETAKTYSGAFFSFCKSHQFTFIAVSDNPDQDQVKIGENLILHLPKKKWGSAFFYHFSQVNYFIKLLFLVLKYKPIAVHITDGVTHFFLLSIFKLMGVNVFVHYHNTIWPKGFRPQSIFKKIFNYLDGIFLRKYASGAFCVSHEIKRQIDILAHGHFNAVYVYTPQFHKKDFITSGQLPDLSIKPFKVLFAGRIERNKGVFDLLLMAKELRSESVLFNICGYGFALEELKLEVKKMGLEDVVIIHGPMIRENLVKMYEDTHIVIIPTRSDFAEGFAKVAAESVLLDRPFIASSVVPAMETLGECAIEVPADDIDAYVLAIQKLMHDNSFYMQKFIACDKNKAQFFDEKLGLEHLLRLSVH